jgi:transposase
MPCHQIIPPSTPKKCRRSARLNPNTVSTLSPATPLSVQASSTCQPSTPQKLHPEKTKSEWTTPVRVKIHVMLNEGYTQTAISRITGVPQSTISDIKKTPHSRRKLHTISANNQSQSQGRGRPKKLSKFQVDRMIDLVNTGFYARCLRWDELAIKCGINASEDTIRREMNNRGYFRCKACKKPFMSEDCKSDRRKYSKLHLRKTVRYWRQHVYIDECSFSSNDRGTKWVTRKTGERFHDDCMQWTFHSGRVSVMICGGISYNWKSPLVFLEPTVKVTLTGKNKGKTKMTIGAIDYRDQFVIPILGPTFNGKTEYNGYKKGGQLIEDQASVHGTKGLLNEVKKGLGIPYHWRPASSPDLNPIEQIWRTMKQRIRQRETFPSRKEALKQAIQEEWDKITFEEINSLIDSMPKRIMECHQREGLPTSY